MFWNQNFEPDSSNHFNNTYSESNMPLKSKKHIRGQQFSPCHLKCSQDFVVFTNSFTCSPSEFTGTSIHLRRTIKKAQASRSFFSPFTYIRETFLSEEQCFCVIVMFHRIHNYEICVVLRCIFCLFDSEWVLLEWLDESGLKF